jgi:hypothetical protein
MAAVRAALNAARTATHTLLCFANGVGGAN